MAGIFIAENMASTTVGSLLRSAQQATDIENASVVKLTGLVSGKVDTYTSAAIAANTDLVYLVDGVEVVYDESTIKGLEDFTNEKNKPYRARKPQVGDIFSISAANVTALSTAVVVGNFLETPATGNKLVEKATALSSGVSFGAEILAKWNFGTQAIPMIRVQVTKVL